jgi:hypothetical protein
MRIIIETIPHERQRYETVGDYQYMPDGTLYITVSDMGNTFYEKLVAIHELIEQTLTEHRGLNEPDITDFDLYYEKRRAQGLVDENSEPGFDNNSPYLREHTLATSVEMQMVALAGESWNDYDKKVNEL